MCIRDRARVLSWLAQEKWRLDVFNTHGKIYEASASVSYTHLDVYKRQGSELYRNHIYVDLVDTPVDNFEEYLAQHLDLSLIHIEMCIRDRANTIDKIQHRGIESAQIAEGGLFLGHVRLPIQTEPGDGLAQPIDLAENNGLLLYVGEIYNYPTRYSSDVEYLRDLFASF